jgi:hypothetical protein
LPETATRPRVATTDVAVAVSRVSTLDEGADSVREDNMDVLISKDRKDLSTPPALAFCFGFCRVPFLRLSVVFFALVLRVESQLAFIGVTVNRAAP